MGLCGNLILETRDLLSWIKELSCLNFLRFLYMDAKVFGLYGVRNVIAPKGQ